MQSYLPRLLAECDSGALSWTHWLRWEIMLQDGDTAWRSRRRYCFSDTRSCILEEKVTAKCCNAVDAKCEDEELVHCSFVSLEPFQ